MLYWDGQTGEFQKLSKGSKTLCMTSEGLGIIFKGDFADMCGKQILLLSTGAKQRLKLAQSPERGPPSAPADFLRALSLGVAVGSSINFLGDYISSFLPERRVL
jgi:hypothetical protein